MAHSKIQVLSITVVLICSPLMNLTRNLLSLCGERHDSGARRGEKNMSEDPSQDL